MLSPCKIIECMQCSGSTHLSSSSVYYDLYGVYRSHGRVIIKHFMSVLVYIPLEARIFAAVIYFRPSIIFVVKY